MLSGHHNIRSIIINLLYNFDNTKPKGMENNLNHQDYRVIKCRAQNTIKT